MQHQGWILDLYPRVGQMIVWLKRQDGTCVRLVDRWRPRIYVGGDFGDLLNLACQPYMTHVRFAEKVERPGDQSKSRVLEVEVKSEKEASALADRIQREGGYSRFRLYNVDIAFTQMYLYEKDLFPLAYVEAENEGGGIKWTVHDSRETIEYPLPPLKQVKLQIQTSKSGRIRKFDDELHSITISHGEEKTVIDFGDEAFKLLKLVDAFKHFDQTLW